MSHKGSSLARHASGLAVACLLAASVAAVAAPQEPPLPPPLATVQLPPPPAPADGATGIREIRARLTSVAPPPGAAATRVDAAHVAAAQPPPVSALELVSNVARRGPLRVERTPRLSPTRFVLVSVDRDGTVLHWQTTYDPRIVRAESAGPDGQLSGTTLYRTDTDLWFAIPDDPRITAIHVYRPAWTGEAFDLEPVGLVDIGQR